MCVCVFLFNIICVFKVSQKELKEALRRQWSQLLDKKRLKWISKALELQKDYGVREHHTHIERERASHSDRESGNHMKREHGRERERAWARDMRVSDGEFEIKLNQKHKV